MSVKFDDELNNEIERTFRNFNSKVRRNKTRTRGKGMLPFTVSAKTFKEKYSDKTRAEIIKQLKLYQSYSNRDAMKKVSENSRISKWELNFFRKNYDKTLAFYDKEIAELTELIGGHPEYYLRQHTHLQTLEDKREFLTTQNLESLSEDYIKIMRNVFNYAERSELVKRQGFRLYLSQLERVMKLQGIPKSKRDAFLDKFNVLSENEFLEMVRNEDAIDAVYTMIYSPKERGKYELLSDDEHTNEALNKLFNEADSIIAKYKKHK